MSSKKEESIEARRERMEKSAKFYKQELDLILPYRDFLKCQVEIMQFEMYRDEMIAKKEDFESARKTEKTKE